MPDRLTLASLARVPGDVAKPRYDPAGVTVGILHLGLGAFHRAHHKLSVKTQLVARESVL
jgi:fructuronate reductase